jgi:3',5'-cyclic AMP phosphodiesterase CpdA
MFDADPDETLTTEGGSARRGLLKCMAWAGAGAVWTLAGGAASSTLLGQAHTAGRKSGGLIFVQISDTHIGFDKAANPDTMATLSAAIDHIRAMPIKPAFLLHTGDITHLAKAEQFDAADQALKAVGVPIFHTPGEHDTLDEGHGKLFLDRFGAGTKGEGWYSFDHGGVHFVALINVTNLQPDGRGSLGADQIAWLNDDLAHLRSSTPIVVFAHMPLWDLYNPWGWGTVDADQAMAALRRFGSVTVLNGHIHQVIEKVEGNVSFHTARSTAYPQPAPGAAPSPGPLKVPAEQLRSVLGVRELTWRRSQGPLALVETDLAQPI